jgi:ketosteroid isomerase-like protein
MSHNLSVDEFFELMNTRDLNRLEELLNETAEFYFPKARPLLGKRQVIRFFRILFREYPELVFHIQRKIIQGSRAAVHWVNRGVNRDGQPYDNEGVTILEVDRGKITFISDFFKDTGKF